MASLTTTLGAFDPAEEIRIVLLGKTGNGKSSSGNTILGRTAFMSRLSPSSITSECEKAKGTVDGYKVAVIDTPGIFDTKYAEKEVVRKLKECISFAAPGPHAFLIVVNLVRFTEEEQKTIELLQMVFGEKSSDYSLVLFTHGDILKSTTIEQYFSRSERLIHLIDQCKRRYHVLNDLPNKQEVSQLLMKIVNMTCVNRATFYTNAMFQEAERAIRKQAEQVMRANAEQQRKQEEILKAMFEGERLSVELNRLQEEYAETSREKAEKKNKFINTGAVVTSAELGVAVGAAAGAVGGPVLIVVGALVGGATGALTGLFTSAAVKALKRQCTMQ